MKLRASRLAVAVVLLLLSARAVAVEGPTPVPFGHADWKASPTDPVGFCGQGNNWYPGATPPTEWWEGTPARVKVKVGPRTAAFTYGEYPTETDADGYADTKSKNILWKAPLPGWSDSLPIVIGKQVITLTSPHYVTCWDADTGKVLWQSDTTIVDTATGKTLALLPGPHRGVATLAGNLLITARGSGGAREREDRMMIATFSVFDVSDPTKPRLVSGRNLLGNADTPADIADKYFPEFRNPELKKFALGYYLGIGGYFGVRTGGVTAHGSRLYIQSQTHLYCIGNK